MDEFLTDEQMAALEGGGDSGFISDEQMAMLESPQLPASTGSFWGDTLDSIGGASGGYLKGLAGAFGGAADLGASLVASPIKSIMEGDLQWAPSTLGRETAASLVGDFTGDIGQNSAVGRIADRAGELTGTTAGFLTGGGGLKALGGGLGKLGSFLSSGPKAQLLLSALGGTAGQTAAETGAVERGGLGQMGVEVGTMMAPSAAQGLWSLGKGALRKLYQGATPASGEVINAVKNSLDDTSPLFGSSGTGSAQALREERLGELAKLARTEAGQGVGGARQAVEELSSEVADDLAYLSVLKKEKKFPSAGTNLQQVSDEISRITSKLDEVPTTLTTPSEFPLVNEKYGNIIKGIGDEVSANPIKGAIEDVLSAKAEFSGLAKELQTVFKTGKNIGQEAYMEAASKVGARLKEPQAAKAFVELAEGNKEMLSIGKTSLLQNVFSGTPTSWAKNINKSRGAMQELFTPSQIDGLEAVAKKSTNLVGGLMVSQPVRFLGNKLVYLGLAGGALSGAGLPAILAGAAIGKVAKIVAEKPQIMQELISKAFQSGEAATLLSQKATPQNIKAATEFFTNAGKNLIMGAGKEYVTPPDKSATINLPQEEKKSEKILAPETILPDVVQPKQSTLPAKLIKNVIAQESSFNPRAVGPETRRHGTAKGLMQLVDATGREWHEKLVKKGDLPPGKYDPFDAEQNQVIGTAYLEHLADRYDGDVRLALAAYNWGMGNLDRLIKKVGSRDYDRLKKDPEFPDETFDYVKKISKNAIEV